MSTFEVHEMVYIIVGPEPIGLLSLFFLHLAVPLDSSSPACHSANAFRSRRELLVHKAAWRRLTPLRSQEGTHRGRRKALWPPNSEWFGAAMKEVQRFGR